jgi:hypothetical protein
MDRLPRTSQITMSPAPSHEWHSVAEWIGDILGSASIFATGYLLLLIGHGLGLS